MKNNSLGFRLLASSFWAVFITGILCGVVSWQIVSHRVSAQAAQEATRQSETALSEIAAIDQLSRAQVESAMRLLQDLGKSRGLPELKGTATVSGKTVPDLHLGSSSQVLNFEMVDHVKALAGGTATLFAFDGTNFTRVTTNVLKPDGSRAVGTILDPRGKAYAALMQGQSFTGVVDILGSPYTTSYAPMLDSNGRMVGAWYTGYRLDSIASLGKSIRQTRILDHGFVALLKPSGAVVFQGGQLTDDALGNLRAQHDGWMLQESTYPGWGYIVLTAYPASDVFHRLLLSSSYMAIAVLLLLGLSFLMIHVLLNRQVIRPVQDLTHRLEHANLNTLLETGRQDEIGVLAESFNRFVLRLRQTLLRVQDSSEATNEKSEEIRQISHRAAESMSSQSRAAEEASGSVNALVYNINSSSRQSDEASAQTRLAADAARRGGEEAATVAKLIQGLSEDTQQSASRVSTLTERTRQIGSIVGVIEEIAAGTNLLALNASIEAARAGEHGRGFAVVAGEVRRLAERTAQATQQVASLVSGIGEETGMASQGILDACRHAGESAEAVQALRSTFERIAALVIDVERQMEQIAGSAHDQSATAESVSDNIQRMAQNARESARGAEQIVHATNELESTAHRLAELVHEFNLHEIQ
jgi:methyl-accepting chemotaxis protein